LLKQGWCTPLPLLLCRAARLPARVIMCSTLLMWHTSAFGCTHAENIFTHFPDAAIDASFTATSDLEAAASVSDDFGSIEEVFQHVSGVNKVIAGHVGGTAASANYARISSDRTRHAESADVRGHRAKVAHGQSLQALFAVAHEPVQLDRQGLDRGSQSRSVALHATKDQQRIAAACIEQLDRAPLFAAASMTSSGPLIAFDEVEDYHQNYASRHPDELHVVLHDAPKTAKPKKQLPGPYVERMAMDGAMPDCSQLRCWNGKTPACVAGLPARKNVLVLCETASKR
jgi:peptide-methionine (S)-S-oxide reductase